MAPFRNTEWRSCWPPLYLPRRKRERTQRDIESLNTTLAFLISYSLGDLLQPRLFQIQFPFSIPDKLFTKLCLMTKII